MPRPPSTEEQRKAARLATLRRYRTNHPEKSRAMARASYAKNPKKYQAYRTSYKQLHIEELQTSNKKYRADNQEKIQTARRIYNAKNTQKRSTSRRAWYLKHQKEQRAYSRQYIANHPESNRAAARRHRALKKGASIVDFTKEQWREVQAMQDHRCYYCQRRYKGKLTQDHITPLSKGGSHTLHNVIAACHSCNSRKGNRPPPVPVQPLLLTVAAKKYKRSS
jgi:5-methylcytosine-specific restriction endonuclease McrA